jgi:hypothetical protein
MEQKAEQIKRYYETQAVSQSQIKAALSAGEQRKKNEQLLLQGSVFDTLVLTPRLYRTFFYEWKVGNSQRPNKSVTAIIDEYHSRFPESTDLTDNLDELTAIIESRNYQPNWKLATRIHNVVAKGGNRYLSILHEIGDRKLVLPEIRIALQRGIELTRFHIEPLLIGNYDVQHPIYFTHQSVACKGLADIVVFADDAIQLYDIKWTGLPLSDYMTEIRRRRSDIQASFYKYGLEQLHEKETTCSLIVYSDSDKEVATYKFSDLDLKIARFGAIKKAGEISINNEIINSYSLIKGWENYFNPPPFEPPVSIWN